MAVVLGCLPLARISRLPEGGAASEDSLASSSFAFLRQRLRACSGFSICSPIQKHRYYRPGHWKAVCSEVARTRQEVAFSTSNASDSALAINSHNLKSLLQDGLETPMALVDRCAEAIRHPFAHLEVGTRWREIQGENDWQGLLDPLDPILQGELVRYGELAQATYDAFDYDTGSKLCGDSKYNKKYLLQKVGLENRGYEVTDYIYATSGEGGLPISKFFTKFDGENEDELENTWDKESNWMGFVAVATDPQEIKRLGRRDIVVAWRGTVTKLEWLEDLNDYLIPTGLDPRRAGQSSLVNLKVEAGFLQMYKSDNKKSTHTIKSARRQLLEAITRLLKLYKDQELSITVAGHSLGSALAVLSGYDLAESGINQVTKLPEVIHKWDAPDLGRDPNEVVEMTKSQDVKTVPITIYSFAGPRVGNDAFRDRVEELGVKVLRVVNVNDKVPEVPGMLFNERLGFLEHTLKPLWRFLDSLPWTYSHVGVPLFIDNLMSPCLRKTKDLNDVHNLEAYLHVLSGFHGTGLPFSLSIDRDLALVNKASNILHRRHGIPPVWWQEENKGLVRTKKGHWIPRTRELSDCPE